MSTQNFMSYGDAETIFTDVQSKKFSTGNVSTIQSTLTASKAYNQNDPFIYNGQLYKADSAIAQGDTITIGTNASATTIEELINLHSSSGSGGHTILNGSGSAMTQRGKLQFDGLNVSDDSGNDKTVVKSPIFNGTTAQWEALSSAEKAKYTVVNLTDDYGKAWKLLRTVTANSDTSSLNISLANYSELRVDLVYNNNYLIESINIQKTELYSLSSDYVQLRPFGFVGISSYAYGTVFMNVTQDKIYRTNMANTGDGSTNIVMKIYAR